MTTPTLATIERGSFAGHETFPLRYTWLRKAVQHVEKDPRIFQNEDAMVQLGVGKNMVRSIRHWGFVCGVLEESPGLQNNRGRVLRPTALGRALFENDGWDPYLEDPATLWLLHYTLASAPDQATTWYLAFNHLPQPEFTKDELVDWLEKLSAERSWARVSPASLRRDVDVFLRTYVPSRASRTVPLEDTLDSPLIELELIREHGKGTYLIQRGDPPTLPDAVFAYGLVSFLKRNASTSKAIPLHSIAFAPGSPGRVFALTEDALMARLERIEAATDGAITFHDTAGLRQLLVHGEGVPELLDVLRPWYEGRDAAQRRASGA
jgi:hypothetical protein